MTRKTSIPTQPSLPTIMLISLMPSSEGFIQFGGEKHPAIYIPSNLPPKEVASRIIDFVEDSCNYGFSMNPSQVKKADAKTLVNVLTDKWNSKTKRYDSWSIDQLEFHFHLTKSNKNADYHKHIGFNMISGR